MTDFALTWRGDRGMFDLQLDGEGGLETGRELESYVVTALFTDRLAEADDVLPDDSGDRRGWWGDAFEPNADRLAEGFGIGSRLWLLNREKVTPGLLARVDDYVDQALRSAVDLGAVARVGVEVERVLAHSMFTVAAVAVLHRTDGTSRPLRFDPLWRNLNPVSGPIETL